MDGLRVYINSSDEVEPGVRVTFYTRRSDGPYYCWSYEKQARQWQVGRVHLPDLNPRLLRTTSWRTVPPELQAKMVEHYLE